MRRHRGASLESIEWVHRLLHLIAGTGFVAPVPVARFDGSSVAVVDGDVHGALTYVPGEVVGWAAAPAMGAMGAFLAEFHGAVDDIDMGGQRSQSFPLDELPAMEVALTEIGHGARRRGVVHGDFTNHNVLASGDPRRPVGVIDFLNAYVEVPLFDIGAALWRSGRPFQESEAFDAGRIVDYVDGYASVRPLDDDDRAAITVYLRARGEQILAKQAARGIDDDGPRRRLQWLARHESVLR